jgi:Icc-related predicted phosphoesterase
VGFRQGLLKQPDNQKRFSECPTNLRHNRPMRAAWLTDLHLNFTSSQRRARLYSDIRLGGAEAVLLGGDIGEANSVCYFLTEMEEALQMPIYFVLGNHDFYGGSITTVHEAIARRAASSRWLRWLSACGPVGLTARSALMGHDSWADGRLGDFFQSEVLLNDYRLIAELRGLDKPKLFAKLNELGDCAADYLERCAAEALALRRNVVVLTHVPPFREACWHEGRISDDHWLPHFASKSAGERLKSAICRHSDRTMTVLCGHTHSSGRAEILPNLTVLTGRALYGEPEIQETLEIE